MILRHVMPELREWFATSKPPVEIRGTRQGAELTFPFTVTEEFLSDNADKNTDAILGRLSVGIVKQDFFRVVKWGDPTHEDAYMRAMTGYRTAGHSDEEVNVFLGTVGIVTKTSTDTNEQYSKLTLRVGWELKNDTD